MINLEKYKEELKKHRPDSLNCEIFKLRMGKARDHISCGDCISCDDCWEESIEWLLEEYKEPEIDWTKVERGTPVLVRDDTHEAWYEKRFFAYDTNFKHPFIAFESYDSAMFDAWKYCKLKEDEK